MWRNLEPSSLSSHSVAIYFKHDTVSGDWQELVQCQQVGEGGYARQLCVRDVSLWNLSKNDYQTYSSGFHNPLFIFVFVFVFVQFVCHATQILCQVLSLNIKTISIELLWL